MSRSPRALLVAAVALVLATIVAMPDQSWAPRGEIQAKGPAAVASAVHASTDLEGVWLTLQHLAEQRRQARLRELRGRRTVPAALERAALRREISPGQLRYAWRTLAAARRMVRRWGGASEVAVVLARTRDLAERLRLHGDRIPAQILTLGRNVLVARRGTVPGNRERMRFPGDPVVYERYAGEGLQIQWLGSWGRVNWRAGLCLDAPKACPRRRFRAAVDRLVALGSSRGGFLAWEYRFGFGGGSPPWVSAITQATAAQALARAGRILHDRRYRRLARSAIGAFATAPPTGVSVPGINGGRHYLMYSFNPGLRILNGHVQALVALADVARLTGSHRARRLFRLGARSGAEQIRAYDTGAWSLYSSSGEEASLNYHRLVVGFLGDLCQRMAHSAYCDASRRFTRYEHEPPRLHLALAPRLRAKHLTTVRLDLSKMSTVSVRALGPSSTGLLAGIRLPYGDHVLRWFPSKPGRYRIVIHATDLAGNDATKIRAIRVRPAHKPKRKHHKKKHHGTPKAR